MPECSEQLALKTGAKVAHDAIVERDVVALDCEEYQRSREDLGDAADRDDEIAGSRRLWALVIDHRVPAFSSLAFIASLRT